MAPKKSASRVHRARASTVGSRPELRKHMSVLEAAMERHRREFKYEHSHSITAEALERKLKRVNSPMVYWEAWSGSSPGSSFNYYVAVYNPDPVTRTSASFS